MGAGGGVRTGPDSFPYSRRQELPLGAFPDPKLSLAASLQLLGILVTTLHLSSVIECLETSPAQMSPAPDSLARQPYTLSLLPKGIQWSQHAMSP